MDIITDGITYDVKSVIKDGVEYQFPGVSQEEYDELLGKYNGAKALYSGIVLADYSVDVADATPTIRGSASMMSGGNAYGVVLVQTYKKSDRSEHVYLVGVRKRDGVNYEYCKANCPQYSGTVYTAKNFALYINYSDSTILGYCFVEHPYLGGYWYKYTFNYSTFTVMCDEVESGTPPSGYSTFSQNDWIANVIGTNTNDENCIRITIG